jgi:mRNA-degrading endonuclease toxin of MazEF toxin-antitoxin module
MRQWDVVQCDFPFGKHPAVILSHDDLCTNDQRAHVNVLACTTLRPNKPTRRHEIILDIADGLDWATLVQCNFIFLALKKEVVTKLGAVNHERRRAISRKIIECFKLQTF